MLFISAEMASETATTKVSLKTVMQPDLNFLRSQKQRVKKELKNALKSHKQPSVLPQVSKLSVNKKNVQD